MRRLLGYLSLLACGACCGCALAFSPGVGETAPPAKFQDPDTSSRREATRKEEGNTANVPAFGMSLVVGGSKLDAGTLPKPPIPVVVLP